MRKDFDPAFCAWTIGTRWPNSYDRNTTNCAGLQLCFEDSPTVRNASDPYATSPLQNLTLALVRRRVVILAMFWGEQPPFMFQRDVEGGIPLAVCRDRTSGSLQALRECMQSDSNRRRTLQSMVASRGEFGPRRRPRPSSIKNVTFCVLCDIWPERESYQSETMLNVRPFAECIPELMAAENLQRQSERHVLRTDARRIPESYGIFIREAARLLSAGGRFAILMGDYSDRAAGFVPLTHYTKQLAFAAGLEQACTDIIRFSHGASSSRKTYRSSFIPVLDDVCMIFEKRKQA